MGHNRRLVLMCMTTTCTLMLLIESTIASATLHKVGANQGWNQNVNYSKWSLQQHIYVYDWLIFVFDKRYYNVLEVNKTSYDNCNDKGFISNITRGGRDVVQLNQARTYYFLSGGGYCYHGMKVAVLVENGVSAPAPAPAESSSPLFHCFTTDHRILLGLALAMSYVTSFLAN